MLDIVVCEGAGDAVDETDSGDGIVVVVVVVVVAVVVVR